MVEIPKAGQVEAVDFDYPEYHVQGMGCGLEGRGITDRYEAMAYGFQEALDQMATIIDRMGPLYLAPPSDPGTVPVHGEQQELEWLEGWLRFAAEPIGQECCNLPGFECCGCPDTYYRTSEDIAVAMATRHKELRALSRDRKG